MRSWFFTGLLVTAPVLLTIYITWLFVDVIDSRVEALMPSWVRDYIFVNAPVVGKLPGVGLLIGVVMITVIGAVAAGFMGRWLISLGERILNRMPVVGQSTAPQNRSLKQFYRLSLMHFVKWCWLNIHAKGCGFWGL